MNDKQKAIFAIVAVSLVGEATAAITKIGLVGFPPFGFIFLRFCIASVCIILFVYLKKKNFRFYFKLAPLSLLASFNILYLFYKEKMRKLGVFGLILGFLGTGLVILLPAIENNNPFAGNLLGNLLI